MMYGIENKDKDMGFGYDIFPDRKNPSICIREGSSIYSLGHFDSEEKAQYFVHKVIEILSRQGYDLFGNRRAE